MADTKQRRSQGCYKGRVVRKLTPKQENFCIAYLRTGNACEAYKIAYPASLKWKSESVRRKAFDAANDVNIQTRLKELRAPAIQKAQITFETHLSDLRELREEARAAENFGPAVTAEISRGKAAGFYVEKVEVKNTYEEMPADARKARIAQLMEKFLATV